MISLREIERITGEPNCIGLDYINGVSVVLKSEGVKFLFSEKHMRASCPFDGNWRKVPWGFVLYYTDGSFRFCMECMRFSERFEKIEDVNWNNIKWFN